MTSGASILGRIRSFIRGLIFIGYFGVQETLGQTAHEALLWSDEFSGIELRTQPDSANWTYDIGSNGWGNDELETYCAWGSKSVPCDPARPNAFIGGGYLHLIARNVGGVVFTSARLKTQGLRSFQYGRIEARIKIPEGQGIWPAFWMLGDDVMKAGWPACGELDIMENIGRTPSVVYGSIHASGVDITRQFTLPDRRKLAADFHIYGLIRSPGSLRFYIDDPTHVYAAYSAADLPKNVVWPFDRGRFFLILNLAVGGRWPGNPDTTTRFPQEMLVDYVRVYTEQGSTAP